MSEQMHSKAVSINGEPYGALTLTYAQAQSLLLAVADYRMLLTLELHTETDDGTIPQYEAELERARNIERELGRLVNSMARLGVD